MNNLWSLATLLLLLLQSTTDGSQVAEPRRAPKRPKFDISFVANVTRLLNTLLSNKTYDMKIRPGLGRPVIVNIEIDIRSMGPINEKAEMFSMDCYFRQRWIDERLQFGHQTNMSTLVLAYSMLSQIWKPDTYIRNSRGSYLHKLTTPNVLLRVARNGEVYISQRLTIETNCPMHFRKYPADTQACAVEIGSLGHSVSDVQYRWKELEVNKLIKLAQYELTGAATYDHNITDPRGDNFEKLSVVKVYFRLKRQFGYYLLQVFLPMLLIVVISWVSFWIDKDASPARVSLGVLTVLNMSTLGTGHREHLPKVGYSTALDLYIVGCFVFLFAAVVEYAAINFVERHRDKRDMLSGASVISHTPDGVRMKKVSALKGLNYMRLNSVRGGGFGLSAAAVAVKESSGVDRASKHLFPAAYGLFNLLFACSVFYLLPDKMPDGVVFRDATDFQYK